MTENHDDVTGRTEPVLVRPYVKSDTEDSSAAETWPEAYDREAQEERPAEADTAVQPVVVIDEEPVATPARRPRLVLRLLALIVGVALAGGIAYVIADGNDTPRAEPGALLPKPDNAVPIPAGGASAPGKASPSAKVSSSASASASAPVSASALAPQVSGSASVPAVPPPSATATAGPTLDPPPGSDVSGKITAASGRCLMRGGLLGVDGSPVQVAGCGVASTFTLAADGTLRVSGRCAQVTGDSTVRIDDCGGQDSAQWRRGPGDSLVNPASGQCLTDPGRSGATTKASACTGGSEQQWSLP